LKPIARNALALIIGIIIGSVVNMAFVQLGPLIIPLPDGADVSTMEGVKKSMDLFQPANFLFPFLAHAVGTLTGAFITAKFAFSHRKKFGMAVSGFFLVGGITAAIMIGGPGWFNAADLILAYIPMGWLGVKMALKK